MLWLGFYIFSLHILPFCSDHRNCSVVCFSLLSPCSWWLFLIKTLTSTGQLILSNFQAALTLTLLVVNLVQHQWIKAVGAEPLELCVLLGRCALDWIHPCACGPKPLREGATLSQAWMWSTVTKSTRLEKTLENIKSNLTPPYHPWIAGRFASKLHFCSEHKCWNGCNVWLSQMQSVVCRPKPSGGYQVLYSLESRLCCAYLCLCVAGDIWFLGSLLSLRDKCLSCLEEIYETQVGKNFSDTSPSHSACFCGWLFNVCLGIKSALQLQKLLWA